ncbi:MAG TPA: T9SS type A sorting domain-containing protein [Bacteroidales bacterium]|nr:T9SS type A sorting domain-containing protein [Bacteroidales bacterium]
MKRLTLLILSIVFALNVNAQIGITTQPEKFKTLKSSEKELPVTYDLPSKKAYEKLGWVHSTEYLNKLTDINNFDNSYVNIVADSCLMIYVDDKPGQSTGLIGFGMTFDPYSKSFDQYFQDGLLPSPPQYTHPYRLDSIIIRAAYHAPLGYNSASPDILRAHVFYLDIYKQLGYRTDYYTVYYLTDQNRDTMYLAPCVRVTGFDKSKGGKIVPFVNNKTFDYILTEKDISYTWDSAGTKWFRSTIIQFPLNMDGITQDGFEVPYGAVLGVMFHFVPGFDYELGDTLYHGLTDPLDETKFADGYPIRVKNSFSLNYFYKENSTAKVFADPFGYNNAIVAYRDLLYQLDKDDYGNPTFRDSCYSTPYGILPYIFFNISADEEQGGNDFPNAIIETNDLISNIYPNPANDKVSINLKNNGNATIQLFNILGQEVKTVYTTENKVEVNVSDLNSGIYFIRVDQNNKTFTAKIMKQ